MEQSAYARDTAVFSGGGSLTDPIVGNWEKEVPFAGRMCCRFYPNNTGVAIGKVLGYDINELFTWTPKENDIYHICAAGHEHDIRLCGDRLETKFRGYSLDMTRIKYNNNNNNKLK
jgi:hypothetical protein